MTGFELMFGLFSLLLGLALAEGLGGLARALKARHRVRIGWPTALLALLVSCDVVTFWLYGWGMQDRLKLGWPVLFGGFLVTGTYFVAASLIFPDDPEDWGDLNGHFDRHRRLVLGAVLACNTALLATVVWVGGLVDPVAPKTFVIVWSLFPVCALAIIARDRRVVVACMLWLIALYPLSAVWH